jgi:hypothetical protein
MINFKNHEITSIKFYCNSNDSLNMPKDRDTDLFYNELFSCSKCNWKGWNFNFTDDEDIISCDEWIIKNIIE